MSVIVDTSVWSLALRRRNPLKSREINALIELIHAGDAVLIGAVRQEILSGVKFVEQFERLEEALISFPDEPVTTADYVEAARITNRCMASGVLTGNTDSLICAVALSRGLEILTTDKDFNHIASVVPIQLH